MSTDIDECADSNGYCQHNCHNTHGCYYCTCDYGYAIDTTGNGSSCVGKSYPSL